MGLVEFKNKMNRIYKDLIVTITTQGNLVFNSRCCFYILRGYKYAVFWYDSEEKRIVIQLIKKKKENSYAIIFSNKTKTSAKLSGRAFLNASNISYDQKQSFIARWDEKRETIDINLN